MFLRSISRCAQLVAAVWAVSVSVAGAADAAGVVTLTEDFSNDRPAFSPDGKLLATRRWDRIRILDPETGAVIHEFPKCADDMSDICWSPDGTHVVAIGDAVIFWNVPERRREYEIRTDGRATAIAFSDDGTRVATGYHDGTIRIGSADGKGDVQVLPGHQAHVTALIWQGGRIFSAGGYGDGSVVVREGPNRDVVATLRVHEREVIAMSLHPDGTSLVTVGGDDRVRLWNTVNGEPVRTFEGAENPQDVAFTPDGKRVVSNREGELVFWNTDGTGMRTVPGHDERIRKISVSADNARVASAGGDTLIIRMLDPEPPADPPAGTQTRGDATRSEDGDLHRLASWTIVRGDWQEQDGRLIGGNNSRIVLGRDLPNDLVFRFRMKVLAGMRPRVRFGSFHFGNEGYQRRLFLHGRKAEGTPVPYKLNEEIGVEVRIEGGSATLRINGELAATARVPEKARRQLTLEGSDGWRPGTTEFHSFELLTD